MLRIYISCYQYQDFIEECLSSVARQTRSDFICTIVDDGSTDLSYLHAKNVIQNDSRFILIHQSNLGQLSVFNRAAGEADDDDLIFFLDADDIWSDNHLEIVSESIANTLQACDFVFTGKRQTKYPQPFQSGHVSPGQCYCLGTTSGITRAFYTWIGDVTSTICLRGRLLKRLLPYPFAYEWRTRADDCLVLGASITGAIKGYIDETTVLYRIHAKNNLFGQNTSGRCELPSYRIAKERYVNWLCQQEYLDRIPCFRLVLAELALSNAWLPFSIAKLSPESALVTPWPWTKRLQVMIAIVRARLSCTITPICKRRTLSG